MIWYRCQQCGKVYGRPENSAGTMVFCACGQGNLVPWESTAPAPAAAEPMPSAPRLEPLSFQKEVRQSSSPRPRRKSRRSRIDPNFCLNHQTVPSQKSCAECGEAFCHECVVVLAEETLCGPCKNFRVRGWQQPRRVSSLAVSSLTVGLLSALVGMGLPADSNPLWFLIALVFQGLALILGGLGLWRLEKNSRLRGRSLAITGVLASVVGILLTLILTYFGWGIGSL